MFALPAGALAQPSLDPPLAGRPTNFSQLTGRFTIEAKVEPTQALVEDPIALRVVIRGDVARGEPPTRKSLRLFPDGFDESFHVDPVPDRDSLHSEDKTWEFVWMLRPKSTDVRELPSLALAYYSGRFQTAHTDPIALSIKPRPTIVLDELELRSAPNGFLEWAEWSEARRPWRTSPRTLASGAAVWFLVATIVAAWSWRRGGLLAKRTEAERFARRSRLTADAIASLQRNPDDAEAIVNRFLRARFGLTAVDPSSADIGAALKRNGIAAAMRERWEKWHRAAHERRYAPATVERSADDRLALDAITLVQSTEGSA